MAGARIMIVEDDRLVSKDLQFTLDQLGFEIAGTAFSGAEAVLMARETRPDLILMDVNMPGDMDGIQAAELIGEDVQVPVIYLTAYSDQPTIDRAKETSPYGYIPKPFTESQLATTIHVGLNRFAMEQEIKRSEARMRDLYESIPLPTMTFRSEGDAFVIASYNRAAMEMSNGRLADWIGRNALDLYADRPELEADVRQCLETRRRMIREREYKTVFDQGTIDALIYYTFIEPDTVMVHLEDVTERKLAEENLRRYEQIVSTTKDFQAFVDREYRYLAVNSTYARAFGRPVEEIVGTTQREMYGDGYFIMALKPRMDQALAGDEMRFETWADLPVPGKRYLDIFYSPYFNDEGLVAGVVINARDITDQKRTEDKIIATYSEMEQIFNSTGDGLCVIDLNKRILRMNKPFSDIYDMPTHLVKGLNCDDLFDLAACNREECAMDRIKAGERRVEYEARRENREGEERVYRVTCTPFWDAGRNLAGIVVNYRDVTRRIRALEEAKLKEQQLIQADRLSALGILVSGVAHEINNPNGIITLNAPMLKTIWEGAEAVLEEHFKTQGDFKLGGTDYSRIRGEVGGLIDQTIDAGRRIKRIVAELKDFARQDLSDLSQSVDLNAAVMASVSLVSNKIKKSTNNFKVNRSEEEITVKGNYQRLEQVFINVLINACEALTDKEQAVTVTVRGVPGTDRCEVVIQDQGQGIEEKDMNRVFEPFFTSKRDYGGTGLGLSVSHGIIEEHGGTMVFASEPGQGTVCTISLPLEGAEEEQ